MASSTSCSRGAVAAAPDEATPIPTMSAGLQAVAAVLTERREFAVRRQPIIAANTELRERELGKLAG